MTLDWSNLLLNSTSDWSNLFLNHCVEIVNEIKDIRSEMTVTVTDLQTSQLDPRTKVVSPLGLFRQVFSQPQKYKRDIARHLTAQQSQLLIDAVGRPDLFRTDFDFDYLLGHLPYYKSVLALIGELDTTGGQNMFIFPMIQEWINHYCCYLVTSQFKIRLGNSQLAVNLELRSQQNLTSAEIGMLIEEIGAIAMSLVTLYGVKDPASLNLSYTLTPFAKKLDYFDSNEEINEFLISRLELMPDLRYNYVKFTNPISSLSVNSGVTLSMSNNNSKQIKIWRQEEFKKVLIHELIHYYNLEKGDDFTDGFAGTIVNVSNNYPQYSKELFTELQTWLFNLLWVISCNNTEMTISTVRNRLDGERLYSLRQLGHLLQHYDILDIRNFVGLDLQERYCLNANSSVLYYYIYKAVILLTPTRIIESLLLPGVSHPNQSEISSAVVAQLRETLGSQSFQLVMNRILHELNSANETDSLRMMSQ